MRPLLALPLFFGAALYLGGTAHAQQQESRIEKILQPDMNQSFNAEKAKHFGSNAFETKSSKNFGLKALSWPQKFDSKEFLTGSYRNDKNFWMGDFKYSVGDAYSTKPRSLLVLPQKETKAVAVKTAPGMDKHSEAASIPTRDFRGREFQKMKTPLSPDQGANNSYEGTLTELKSIDDVRALLNKSK